MSLNRLKYPLYAKTCSLQNNNLRGAIHTINGLQSNFLTSKLPFYPASRLLNAVLDNSKHSCMEHNGIKCHGIRHSCTELNGMERHGIRQISTELDGT